MVEKKDKRTGRKAVRDPLRDLLHAYFKELVATNFGGKYENRNQMRTQLKLTKKEVYGKQQVSTYTLCRVALEACIPFSTMMTEIVKIALKDEWRAELARQYLKDPTQAVFIGTKSPEELARSIQTASEDLGERTQQQHEQPQRSRRG